MKPLGALLPEEARALVGVVFDLDDTVLDHGELTLTAYEALHDLRAAGLRLVACTGRPAGWAEVIARQWPIDLAIAENGAVALAKGGARIVGDKSERASLLAFARSLVLGCPTAALADDNDARWSDVTIDIGEHRRVSSADVRAMRETARGEGLRTTASSVHLHLSRSGEDKASGTLRALSLHFSEDPTRARARYAFVGDSGNDAPAFAAFGLTFGVANVMTHARGLTVGPRFVADEDMGRGFRQIASALLRSRAKRTPS